MRAAGLADPVERGQGVGIGHQRAVEDGGPLVPLAAQRNTRILGVFTRLWKRDGKPGYRRFQPRMWGLLERDLNQPGLEPVRAWFDANVAPEHRSAPWVEAA